MVTNYVHSPQFKIFVRQCHGLPFIEPNRLEMTIDELREQIIDQASANFEQMKAFQDEHLDYIERQWIRLDFL